MSSRIIEKSENLTARQALSYTSSVNVEPLKDVPSGIKIPYVAHILQEITVESTGEIFESLLLISEIEDEIGEHKIYATRSQSFMKALIDIIESLKEMGDTEPFSIKVEKRKSKAGREFISCSLAE